MKNIIIGGGISGVYLASRLKKLGEEFILIEASDELGGRMKGLKLNDEVSLELGATWYWHELQPDVTDLINELGLDIYDDIFGKTLMEENSNSAPKVINYPYIAGQRIKGGMSKILDKLIETIEGDYILEERVTKIINHDNSVEVVTENNSFSGNKVWLALPPRIIASNIVFEPELPAEVHEEWINADTWMAGQAKYIAIFEKPFWREKGLSGNAFSQVGPMVEIHELYGDKEDKEAAIFGFIGIPAIFRQSLTESEIETMIKKQLVHLYGDEVEKYFVKSYLKDWSQDEFISTQKDIVGRGEHPRTLQSSLEESIWNDNIIPIGSEFSNKYPGYVGGAINKVDEELRRL